MDGSVNSDEPDHRGEGGQPHSAAFRSFSAPSRSSAEIARGVATPAVAGTAVARKDSGVKVTVEHGDNGDDTEPETPTREREETARRKKAPYRSKSFGRRSDRSWNNYHMVEYGTRSCQRAGYDGGGSDGVAIAGAAADYEDGGYTRTRQPAAGGEASPLLLNIRTTTPGGTQGLLSADPYAIYGFDSGLRSGLATPRSASYLLDQEGGLPFYHPAYHESQGNNPYLWSGEEGEDEEGHQRRRPLPLPPSTPASFSSVSGFPLWRQWGYGNISRKGLKILDVPPWNRVIVYRYQLLPGKSVYFLGGKIMMSAKDHKFFALTLFFILAPFISFIYSEFHFIQEQWCVYFPLLVCLLALFSVATACATAFSDPGVLLRSLFAMSLGDEDLSPDPLYRVVTFRKTQQVSQKYCWTCGIWRPLRAVHCTSCDHCIEHFDHHCKWMGNCIGKRNYRFFFSFLWGALWAGALAIAGCAKHLSFEMDLSPQDSWSLKFEEAVRNTPVSMALGCYLLITGAFAVVPLAFYHLFLVLTDLRTFEHLRGDEKGVSQRKRTVNFARLAHVSCGPRYPSWLQRTEQINEEEVDFLQRGKHQY